MSGVRDFLTKLPSGLGAFICGRDHYFDTEQELAHSLVISSRSYVIVRLGEFTEEGANQFLVKNGLSGTLPDWLPRKPLILAYLAQNNLLDEIIKIDSAEGYGYAWNIFIDKITQRESELEKAVMEPSTLRHVMERLAFSVRATVSGSGPITGNHLANAYSIETGQAAGEGVLAQLQRLPGLTQRDQEAGSRSFIDEDMLAALQGSAFSRIILGQYENIGDVPLSPLSHKAISVATHLLNKVDATSATPLSIAERFSLEKKAPEYKQIIADCLAVSLAMAREQGGLLDGHGILIESATFGVVDIEDTRIKNLHFSECIINQVSIGEHAIDSGLTFSNCIIKKVSGIANQKRLPSEMFIAGCEVEEFDYMDTNNAVLQLDIEPQVKTLLTILRKLYRQPGAGRKISALKRGITKQEVGNYIDPVLNILERDGFMRIFNAVVHPVRKQANRVEKILNAPSISDDTVVQHVKLI